MLKFTVIYIVLFGLCFALAESFLHSINAQWGAWGSVHCSITAGRCILARGRNCSVPNIQECSANGGNEFSVNIWPDMTTCPCGIKVSTTSTTLAYSTTTSSHWLEWGAWECHVSNGKCTQLRWRKCSGSTRGCKGLDYSMKLCDGVVCGVSTTTTLPYLTTTSTHWLEWGAWECHVSNGKCSQLRWRNCSSSSHGCKGVDYSMALCDGFTCGGSTTVSPHLNTMIVSAHWLEWGNWECRNLNGDCTQIRWRNCSDSIHSCKGLDYSLKHCDGVMCGDNPAASSSVSSTTTGWSTWGEWACHYHQSPCIKARFRTCLHAHTIDECGWNDYEISVCDKTCSVLLLT